MLQKHLNKNSPRLHLRQEPLSPQVLQQDLCRSLLHPQGMKDFLQPENHLQKHSALALQEYFLPCSAKGRLENPHSQRFEFHTLFRLKSQQKNLRLHRQHQEQIRLKEKQKSDSRKEAPHFLQKVYSQARHKSAGRLKKSQLFSMC